MSDWVSVTEAAILAGVSERTVRRWVKRGRLRAARRGQALMIAAAELADMGGRDGGQADGHAAGVADMSATEVGPLAALIRDLHDENRALAEAAATWQTRAEVLALQLEQAHARLALSAPTEGPQWPVEVRQAPERPDPPSEPDPAPAPVPAPLPPRPDGGSPWWRRALGWLVG